MPRKGEGEQPKNILEGAVLGEKGVELSPKTTAEVAKEQQQKEIL